MTQPGSEQPTVEIVLADCLDRDEENWGVAVEQACSTYPELAPTLRRRFAMIAPQDAQAPHPAPSRLGDFELGAMLGSGGMGVVHLARDVRLGRDVAIKLLRPELLWFEGARERFQREGMAVARLQHPGIVPVLSCGEADGVPFYAMERVDGLGLDEVIGALKHTQPERLRADDVARVLRERCGELDDDALARLTGSWWSFCTAAMVQAADALAHAHSRGVLHRDLKPSNIMVRADGRVQLLDFGLATVAGASRLTATQGVVGSPPYMTPEQLLERQTNARSDVYGLGVTAYELLTLHCPFLRANGEATRRAILDGAHDPLRQRLPRLSWELATIVEVAMDLDPQRRYPSAAAMRDDLDRVLVGEPIVARRAGFLRRTWRWVERHPAQTTALALGFGLAVSIPTLLYIGQRTALQQEQQALARESELLTRTRAALAAERTALDQLTQLADQIKVQQLVDNEDQLWPPLPEVRAGLEDWVTRAEALLERRELHRAALAELRGQALPYSDTDRERDQRYAQPHRDRVRMLELRLKQPIDTSWGSNRKMIAQWREELAKEQQQAALRTWRYPDVRQQWRQHELEVLLAQLDRLEGLLPRVRDRLQKATAAQASTIDQVAAGWQQAAEQLGTDERFDGNLLVPTVGLVPLGPDPESGLQEFAVWCTGAVPKREPSGQLERGESFAIVVILVPGGSFTIGARRPQAPDETGPNIDALAEPAEEPLQEIALDPYLVGKYEVQQAQWQRIMERNPSATLQGDQVGPDGIYTSDRPVDNISWVEARAFCRRLGGDLPTEAQWERAARGGTTTPWWAGDDPKTFTQVGNVCDASVARFGIELRFIELQYDDGYVQAAPVGSFSANPYGLHDTIGNVDEWCLDALSAYTERATPGDGRFTMGLPESRITRGGNFGSVFATVRSAKRASASLDHRGNSLGLRIAMAAPVIQASESANAASTVEQRGQSSQGTRK